LVNSTTKNISEDLLDVETATVKSIVSSKLPDVKKALSHQSFLIKAS